MRRAITAALTVCLLIGMRETAGAETRRHRQCRYQSLRQASWTDTEVRKSIRCAVDHWRVPGGTDQALDTARCESGFEARTSGSHLGVYQWARSSWESEVKRWRERRRRWDVGTNALNARNNVLLAIWHAHTKDGWDPWACP